MAKNQPPLQQLQAITGTYRDARNHFCHQKIALGKIPEPEHLLAAALEQALNHRPNKLPYFFEAVANHSGHTGITWIYFYYPGELYHYLVEINSRGGRNRFE